MASSASTDQLKLLGIWLPPEEKRQIKVAAAARDMTLNQAVREALREWIARSAPENVPAPASVPQPGAKPDHEPASANALNRGRQAIAAKAVKLPASRPRPTAAPPTRPQVSAQRRKADAGHGAAAPAQSGAPFAWLRGAPGLDWSACPAVERRDAPNGSHVWVFRGTNVTLKKVFRLLEEGHPSAKLGRRFNLDPQVFEEVLRFAAQRLAPYLPGAQ